MRKTNIIFLFVLFTIGCKTQELTNNISCGGQVTVQYDKIKWEDRHLPKTTKSTNGCVVYFINEYDDQIKAYVDEKLYFDKYVKITGSSDDHDNYFGFSYSDNSKMPILKIGSDTKKTCFDIQIKKKYKLIYVFLSRDGKWIVRFSNVYYLF